MEELSECVYVHVERERERERERESVIMVVPSVNMVQTCVQLCMCVSMNACNSVVHSTIDNN